MLGSAPVLADGRSPATLRVWVRGVSATDRVRFDPEEGKAFDAEIGPDGVVSFTFVPPNVDAPRAMPVKVIVRGPVLKLDEVVQVGLVPPWEGTVAVSFNPPEFVAGSPDPMVRIVPAGTTPQGSEGRKFTVRASAGTMSEAVPAGDGSWIARWTPPPKIDATLQVLVTAADAAQPEGVAGWGVLPVLVRKNVTFNVLPGTSNLLEVGDRTWGPLLASPAGTVAFDVDVHPARTRGRVVTVGKDGTRTERAVDLPLGDFPRIAFLPLPAAAPADPTRPVQVRFAVVQRDGAPFAGSAALRASAGLVSPVVAQGPGLFAATWAPSIDGTEALLTAEADGQSAGAKVALVPTLPAVTLGANPPELPKGVTQVEVTALVKGPNGAGLVGRAPELAVEGGSLVAKLADRKDGSYTAKARSPGARMVLGADPPHKPTGLGPARLLMWSPVPVVAADGTSQAPVLVAVVDAFGLGVPGVEVALAVPQGDGVLPPKAVTNARGVARVAYRAGTQSGPATMRAGAAGLWTEASVFQKTVEVAAIAVPPSGDAGAQAALARWQSAAPSVIVLREGAAQKAGPASFVTVSTVPPYTTPGAAIAVYVRVADAAGTPLARQNVALASSIGSVGPVSDFGDGSYGATVQLPAGQDGPISLSASAGAARGSLALPTFAAVASGSAAPASSPSTAATPGAPAWTPGAPATARAPRSASGEPRGRVSIALATVPHGYTLTGSGLNTAADMGADALEGLTGGDSEEVFVTRVPDLAGFQNGKLFSSDPFGATGLDLRALWWWKDRLGLEARTRPYLETVDVGGETYSHFAWGLEAGARLRTDPSRALQWYAVGRVHRVNALLFLYGDETMTSVELIHKGLFGLRLGGGLSWSKGPFHLDWLILAETFAPYPVNESGGWELWYDLPNGIAARLALDFELRHMAFDVDGYPAVVAETENPLSIGVVVPIR